MKVLLNGRTAELDAGATVRTALDALDLPGAGRGVAVAVDAEVVPRGAVGPTRAARGRAGRDPARDPGRLSMAIDRHRRRRPDASRGRELRSRLLLGTGGFRSLEALGGRDRGERHASSSPSRCAGSTRAQRGSIVDVLDARAASQLLPNTAGCFTARDAVLTAKLAREAFETDWVKLRSGRRAHAAARRPGAAGGGRAASTTASSSSRIRTTTRSSRAAWRTSAAPR